MRRRDHVKKEENVSYWQSYSDMMAALLLIFVTGHRSGHRGIE